MGKLLRSVVLTSKLPAGVFVSLTIRSVVPASVDVTTVYLCTAYIRYGNPRLVVFARYACGENVLRPTVAGGMLQFVTEAGAAKLCIGMLDTQPLPHIRVTFNILKTEDIASSLWVELRGHLDEGHVVFETGPRVHSRKSVARSGSSFAASTDWGSAPAEAALNL